MTSHSSEPTLDDETMAAIAKGLLLSANSNPLSGLDRWMSDVERRLAALESAVPKRKPQAVDPENANLPEDGLMVSREICKLLGLKPSGFKAVVSTYGTKFERDGYRFRRCRQKRGMSFLWKVEKIERSRGPISIFDLMLFDK